MTLAETQRRFAAWRSTHRKRARLPPQLKTAAVALLAQHSQNQIVKTLGLSSTLLQQWQRQAGTASVKREKAGTKASALQEREVPPAFVDVTSVATASATRGATLTVEVAGRGTIKLSGELHETVVRAAVAAAFAVSKASIAGEVVL